MSETFKIPKAEASDTNKLLKNINIKKATGPETILPQLVKLSSNIIDSHLCNIIDRLKKQFFFRWGKNSLGEAHI